MSSLPIGRLTTVTLAAVGATAAILALRRHHRWRQSQLRLRERRINEAWLKPAADVVAELEAGRVTPEMLIEASVRRIRATNKVNAVVTLCVERARERAAAFARAGGAPGPLFGIPVLVKDNQPIEGVRWTGGSVVHAQRIATVSSPTVQAIERAGGIVLGVTNMPEHAAGSHTFNGVFGLTRNPYDLTRSAGGSSGGGAAALACGAGWLATGTDLGGSLRNPAAFCNVVGLRPTPGRCAMAPVSAAAWRGRWGLGLHSVQGPLGRTVEDVALLLDALAPRDYPIVGAPDHAVGGGSGGTGGGSGGAGGGSGGATPSEALVAPAAGWEPAVCPELEHPPPRGYLHFVRHAAAAAAPQSVAYTVDMGGVLRGVDDDVARTVRRAATLLAAAVTTPGGGGARLTEACPPGLKHAAAIFRTLRLSRQQETVAGGPAAAAAWLEEHAAHTKPELRWELAAAERRGLARDLAQAEHARQLLEREVLDFLGDHDLLLCPCTLMPPFEAQLRYPTRWEPTPTTATTSEASPAPPASPAPSMSDPSDFQDYLEWMLPCSAISLTGLPCVAMPAGCTRDGRLPIGVQLVGQPGGEARLLAACALLQRALLADASNDSFFLGTSVLPVPVDPASPTAHPLTNSPPRTAHGDRPSGMWRGPCTEAEAAAHLGVPNISTYQQSSGGL